MRGRGLKQSKALDRMDEKIVAPHAGAWIETLWGVRLEQSFQVAPHAGAWIETPF